MNNSIKIYTYENEKEWVESLYIAFWKIIEDSFKTKKKINIAISGGQTPIPFFKYICEKCKNDIEWMNRLRKINIFWVDERQVPINHKDSNAGTFIKIIENLPFNYYEIKGDAEDINIEASRYESLIKKEINNTNFDLIILGMGEDGHIASLFPDTKGLTNETELFIPNYIHKNSTVRFTFTYNLLHKTDKIWILLSGEKKMKLIEDYRRKIIKNYPFEKLLLENEKITEIYYYK